MRWDFFIDMWNWTIGGRYCPEHAAILFSFGPLCLTRYLGDQ